MLMPSNGPMDYRITNEAKNIHITYIRKESVGGRNLIPHLLIKAEISIKGDLYYVGIEYLMQTIIFSMNVLSWWIIE